MGSWASDEALQTLHRAIQCEKKEREPSGKVIFTCTRKIPFTLYRNGKNITRANDEAGIVLNNMNNVHWVSVIPKNYLPAQSKNTPETTDELDILNEINKHIEKLQAHHDELGEDELSMEKKNAITQIIAVVQDKLAACYENSTPELSFEETKKRIEAETKSSVTILAKHRDIALPIVASIMACITVLGMIIGAAQLIYTKGNRFLFWSNTTTSCALYTELLQTISSNQLRISAH